MHLEEMDGDLGGVEGGEIVVRIYYMREVSIFNVKKGSISFLSKGTFILSFIFISLSLFYCSGHAFKDHVEEEWKEWIFLSYC